MGGAEFVQRRRVRFGDTAAFVRRERALQQVPLVFGESRSRGVPVHVFPQPGERVVACRVAVIRHEGVEDAGYDPANLIIRKGLTAKGAVRAAEILVRRESIHVKEETCGPYPTGSHRIGQ